VPRPVIGITAGYAPAAASIDARCQAVLPQSYLDAVSRAGGAPVALAPCDPTDPVDDLLDRVDGVVLSGGPDVNPARYGRPLHPKTTLLHPRREAFDLRVFERADRMGLPLLAICLGIQELNVGRGGTLIQDLPSERPSDLTHFKADQEPGSGHAVRIESGTLLSRLIGVGELAVNSTHHQAIEEPGRGLVVSARATDGLIEAVEDPARLFLLGIQWHPERIADRPVQLRLFEGLIEAARGWAKVRAGRGDLSLTPGRPSL
jgi:putative glutamine amidotransferase